MTEFEIPGKALTSAEIECLAKESTKRWAKTGAEKAWDEVKAPLEVYRFSGVQLNEDPRRTDEYRAQVLAGCDLKHLKPEEAEAVKEVLARKAGAFWVPGTPRTTILHMQHDVVPSGPPVKTPPHRLSPEQAQWIDDKVDEEVARGQLVRGSSPWGSPAFPTREAGAHQKTRKRRIVVDYRRVNARTVRAQYFSRKSWEVIAEAAGSLWLTMVDAVTGFNQLQNSDRARRVLAVVTRSGQFLPTCLTFGPVNGPEAFAYVMDRIYARGSGRRARAASEWLAYVDDHTIRSGRMIGGVAYKDSEVADSVRTAVTERAPPESCQDVAEALEAAGFSARGLGVEKKKKEDEKKPANEPDQAKRSKGKKFTTEADRNHPFAHEWWSLVLLTVCLWRCVLWHLVAGSSSTRSAPRVGRGGGRRSCLGVTSGDWVGWLGNMPRCLAAAGVWDSLPRCVSAATGATLRGGWVCVRGACWFVWRAVRTGADVGCRPAAWCVTWRVRARRAELRERRFATQELVRRRRLAVRTWDGKKGLGVWVLPLVVFLVVGSRPPQPSEAQAGFRVGEPLAGLSLDEAVEVGRKAARPTLAAKLLEEEKKLKENGLKGFLGRVRSPKAQLKVKSERLGGSDRAPSATLMTGKKKDHDQGRALSGVLRHGHGFSEVVWDSDGWLEVERGRSPEAPRPERTTLSNLRVKRAGRAGSESSESRSAPRAARSKKQEKRKGTPAEGGERGSLGAPEERSGSTARSRPQAVPEEAPARLKPTPKVKAAPKAKPGPVPEVKAEEEKRVEKKRAAADVPKSEDEASSGPGGGLPPQGRGEPKAKLESPKKEEPEAAQGSEPSRLSSSAFEAFEEENIDWGDDEEVPDLQEDVDKLKKASEEGNVAAREEFLTASLDTENVALAMLNRAVSGTPAKRLLTALIRAATSDALRQSSSLVTLRTALAQAQRDELRAEPTSDSPLDYQGLGIAAKVHLLEVREQVHRSLIVKAKLLERASASLNRLRAQDLGESLSSADYLEAASEWMGCTTSWVGVEAQPDPTAKVRSNRFLADLAAIRQGKAPGDSVWQALQRERSRQRAAAHRLKQQKESTVRLKPRAFDSAEDADASYQERRQREHQEEMPWPAGSWYCNRCWQVVQSDKGEIRLNCNHYYKGALCEGSHADDFWGWATPPKSGSGASRSHGLSQTKRAARDAQVELARDGGWRCPNPACDATNMRGRTKCYKCSRARPAGESPPPGAEAPVSKRRRKGKRKMPPRHGWKRYQKVRGSFAAFRARTATKYYPESGSDVNHPFAQLVMQEGLVTVLGGLSVCLLASAWRQAEVVVDSAGQGVVFVIDTIASVGADAVEMVGFVTKLVLVVYGVVMCLQVVATHWHPLAKLMMLLAGRNPEANVAKKGASPFSVELQAKVEELKKFGVPVAVPDEDADWARFQVQGASTKSYVVRLAKDGSVEHSSCTCMSFIHRGGPCKHIAYAHEIAGSQSSVGKGASKAVGTQAVVSAGSAAAAPKPRAKSRGRAAMGLGPGRQVAFRTDDGSPNSDISGIEKSFSLLSLDGPKNQAEVGGVPTGSGELPASGGTEFQAAETGCWGLFSKATKAVKNGPELQSAGSASSGPDQTRIPGTGTSTAVGPLRPRGSLKEAMELKVSEKDQAAEERCKILELKVKALQAKLRAAEAREESDRRMGEEPWAHAVMPKVSSGTEPLALGRRECWRRSFSPQPPPCRRKPACCVTQRPQVTRFG